MNIVEPRIPPAISSAPATKSVEALTITSTLPMRSRRYDSGSLTRQRYTPPIVSRAMRVIKLHPSSAGEPSGCIKRYSRTHMPNEPAESKMMSVQKSATRRHMIPIEIARNRGDVPVYQSADRRSRESFSFFSFRAISVGISYIVSIFFILCIITQFFLKECRRGVMLCFLLQNGVLHRRGILVYTGF